MFNPPFFLCNNFFVTKLIMCLRIISENIAYLVDFGKKVLFRLDFLRNVNTLKINYEV